MPRTTAGPHLWLRRERRDKRNRRVTHRGIWLIIDGKHQESTKCPRHDLAGAEEALDRYINRKHIAASKAQPRDPTQIPVADVLTLYAERVAPHRARPKEAVQRLARLAAFFGVKMLAEINGELCRGFAKSTRLRQLRAKI